MNFLDGYKVYFTGVAAVVYGVLLFANGDAANGGTNILLGLGLIFGRHTASKIEDKLE